MRLLRLCCWVVFSNDLVCSSDSWKLLPGLISLRDSRALSLGVQVVSANMCASRVLCGFGTYVARRELAYTVDGC